MKEQVTLEELNAATMLILGVPVHQLVEVHVTSTIVSGIAVGEDGALVALRAAIVAPAAPEEAEASVEEPVDAELVEDDS